MSIDASITTTDDTTIDYVAITCNYACSGWHTDHIICKS